MHNFVLVWVNECPVLADCDISINPNIFRSGHYPGRFFFRLIFLLFYTFICCHFPYQGLTITFLPSNSISTSLCLRMFSNPDKVLCREMVAVKYLSGMEPWYSTSTSYQRITCRKIVFKSASLNSKGHLSRLLLQLNSRH